MNVNGTMERATLLHQAGKLEDARRLYLEVSRQAPGFAEVWHRLGLIAQTSGRFDEAATFIKKAIQLDERQPLYFFGLGLVLQDQNQPGGAEKLFRQALMLNPDLAPAYNHLGLILQGEQRFDEALQCFRDAVRCHPGYARAYNNLGNLLRAKGEISEAISCFREAVRLSPDYRLALVNLGKALQQSGDMAGAEECYLLALKLDPNDLDVCSSLGSVQLAQVKMDEAEHAFRHALALKPDNVVLLNWLGYVLREQGRLDECLEVYHQAAEQDSDNFRALLGSSLALPPIYFDPAHVFDSRKKYIEGLARLKEEAIRIRQMPPSQILAQLQWGNFYLAYQGQDDRQLQSDYADFVVDALSSVTPEFFQPIPRKSIVGRRLKVGFFSSFLRECTVGLYFMSWITTLDRTRFDIFVYYTGHWRDSVSGTIEASVEHHAHLIGMDAAGIARRVKGDDIDVLIYPEMGMDVTSYMLGAMRLAPVQCVAWGHPVTTGHRNIDYYLSCASMEPDNAGVHYREQLVLLSGIGTYYKRPLLPPVVDRQHFSLSADRHLYLCPQSLYKIHPDNDEIFLDILEQDQNSLLIFFQGMSKTVTQLFMDRLERGMVARKIEASKRVIFLPRMGHDAYLQVNHVCDVMLDTLHWSGGNTSLDALACGLPMVTLPGEFMRGRQSYAMLKAMSLDELIARDKRDYVAIALRLASDVAWRREIQQRITQNTDKVFENELPLKELERFLLSRFANYQSEGLNHRL